MQLHKRFTHLFVAGTFDGLHKGHRFLLSKAFAVGRMVTVGITSDLFVKKFKVQSAKFKMRTQRERKKTLLRWLGERRKVQIIFINDPYEPAASMKNIDALVVTSQTRKRGEEINQRRLRRGLTPLTLIEVPLVNAQDGKPISASRVLEGEIDREGRLVMPESLRALLGKPLGKILTGKKISKAIEACKETFVITVGDVTTESFITAGRVPNLVIIDGRVERKPYKNFELLLRNTRFHETKNVQSGPGYISQEAIDAIDHFFSFIKLKRPRKFNESLGLIVVDGEEDLLVLPAIIYAQLGAKIYYGQPGKGMVEVPVNTQTKQKAETILHSFLLKP